MLCPLSFMAAYRAMRAEEQDPYFQPARGKSSSSANVHIEELPQEPMSSSRALVGSTYTPHPLPAQFPRWRYY